MSTLPCMVTHFGSHANPQILLCVYRGAVLGGSGARRLGLPAVCFRAAAWSLQSGPCGGARAGLQPHMDRQLPEPCFPARAERRSGSVASRVDYHDCRKDELQVLPRKILMTASMFSHLF